MITLYGKKYAANDRELTETLFQPDGTANGLFRKTKRGIFFIDPATNEARAFIRRDGLGPVSVTKNHTGRRVFMFACSRTDEQWLGVPDSYAEACDGAEALARSLFTALEA